MLAIMRNIWSRIIKYLARDGSYSLDTYAALAALRRWRPQDLIIDVGANDGRSIRRWRRHIGKTRVLAFEPVAGTFAALLASVGMSGEVQCMRMALGEREEQLEIHLDDHSALNSFYRERTSSGRSEMVEVRTLDGVIEREGITSVQLLKIDAEGHDLQVLAGARKALEAGLFEIIQVEAGFGQHGLHDARLRDFIDVLHPAGYHLYAVTNQCRALPRDATACDCGAAVERETLSYCDALFVRACGEDHRPQLRAFSSA
ncbi:MAG: FkbM family methyltransferase [Porphyrobacter sp.]|nr:FkbM family methyltransferase [Porphyrobacter sp.]